MLFNILKFVFFTGKVEEMFAERDQLVVERLLTAVCKSAKNFKLYSTVSVAADDAPSCEVPSRRRTIKPPAWQKDYYMF